jgi:hypothetical protein
VHWLELRDRLDVDDDVVINNEIRAIRRGKVHSLVADREDLLLLNPVASEVELVGETLLVNCLEQSRAELPMHGDGGTDDGSRENIETFQSSSLLLFRERF